MKRFIFHNPGKLMFGEKALKGLAAELGALKVGRALLVTDRTLAGTELVARVEQAMGASRAGTFREVVPDTGIEIIDRAAAQARELSADGVVSVGGGSSIDTGKAIAAMLGTGAGSVQELIGFYKLKSRPAPHLAIPTTAGTGSECTSMAVVRDRAAGKKVLIVDPKLIPEVGLLDPTLSVSLPPAVTAGTGMDAMTHAAEAIMSSNAMPPADALALHSISLIAKYLPMAVAKGDDLAARSMMLVAAAEAGQAFQNAFVGVVHAMAHALGGIFGVPHGLANAMLIGIGMEFNAETVPDRVAMIGEAMGLKLAGEAKERALASAQAMREFATRIGIPRRLAEVGVDPDRLAPAAELALADAALLTNPRQPSSAAELEALFRKCL